MNRHRIVPVLDNGILKLIRKGTVKMFPAIVRRENSTVYSRDGQSDHYHVVVAAIGYEPGEEDIIEIDKKYWVMSYGLSANSNILPMTNFISADFG